MKDGVLRIAVKWMVRTWTSFDLAVTRRISPPPRYRLTGSCNSCGKCCEAPSFQVGRVTFHLKPLRSLVIAWQRLINGFEFTGVEARIRVLVFKCTHYDPATKQCDSYSSRPLMCRDYPRNLAFEAVPSLFDECSHGIVDVNAESFRAALAQANLTPEQRSNLEKKLLLFDKHREPPAR